MALRDQMHRERGTKLAVEAFERMSHRHIWKEEADRQERGVMHVTTLLAASPACLQGKRT